jgi:protein tyrosine phosphatase (PTP) superfamily phosphohydrolase (DUF442 family)
MKRLVAPVLVLFLSAAAASAAGPVERPAEWATAVDGTCVKNLYKIEDGLYRGAQPNAEGFKELCGLGVKAILDVAGGAGDDALVAKDSVKLFHVPMRAWGLRDDRVLEALRVMTDPANRPLLIHCQHGADRTGALVALYRVVVQGWTKEKAVEEMNRGGYHHSSLWRNLDDYVMKADVETLRKALNVTGPPAAAPAPVLAAAPAAETAASSSAP